MDTGEITLIFCRLLLGGLAAFFAIMLWSKTRDIAWMLMAGGTITAYGENLYAMLDAFGLSPFPAIGLIPLAAALSNIPVLFFIAAFCVMVVRSYGRRQKGPSGDAGTPD
ncbi:MAG: hypothetical protein LBB77_08700 [Treponema sp.]|jgi:hypothetical protein|nr:hypothetical protein [Treponema sp.]